MITHLWHSLLGMPKHDEDWHRKDIEDELAEYRESRGLIHRWSELSDLVYTYTRARWSGHRGIPRPTSLIGHFLGSLYMYPKYTLRYSFFALLGRSLGSQVRVRCVRNPKKVHKLHALAEEYGLDPKALETKAASWLRFWPLLP